jgi:hypothetical protein
MRDEETRDLQFKGNQLGTLWLSADREMQGVIYGLYGEKCQFWGLRENEDPGKYLEDVVAGWNGFM